MQEAVLYGNLEPLDAGGRKRLIFILSVSPAALGLGRDGGWRAGRDGDCEWSCGAGGREWSRVEGLNSWVPTIQRVTVCRNKTNSKS